MPAVTSNSAAEETGPNRWLLWVGLACLALAVSPYGFQAIIAWRTSEVLRDTVTRFFHDVASGRRDAALAYLSDDYRSSIEPDQPQQGASPWQPSDEFSSRVVSIQHASASAEVHVVLARSGFTVKPTVYLHRLPDQTWRITRIDGVAVDPHWKSWQEKKLREPDESLANDLAEKLTGSRLK